ncbi:diacylglycerol/lipid kinase family protein [Parapedobacter sp. 10938]|uniref:diacylglycerol/lipid kinase family protein n=1 Tax=Parapedobacter flavus TaxID=3110225 RepID=UPI002DB7D5C3|nr:YegS/Rv2252/BmrU family lipid kinase [Parapedobacter sp. 10938]MEC3880734.1 YegS/Rv2252/BmrU family lipid kinase [Parapedobacter sp. 10938]
MTRKQRILFVVNPISGGRKKKSVAKRVMADLDTEVFDATFAFTGYAGHAKDLAAQAVANGVDVVVAVGGDGTINEIAAALNGTETALGIIPEGSGNGLALYLGIPLNERAAIRRLNRAELMTIDSGAINCLPFFNMAGIGFDASVSDRFANDNIRGAIGYMKAVISEISTYKPKRYVLDIDGRVLEREAFMISVANSPQYGNNAYVAPQASVTDGLLDVCIIHKFPLYTIPMMVYHLFNKTADQSEYVEIIPGKHIRIEREAADAVHVDGEPKELGTVLDIEVRPATLRILC